MAKAKQGKSENGAGPQGSRSESPRKASKPARSLGRTVLTYGLAAVVWVALAVGLVLGFFALGLPRVDEAVLTRRPNIVLADESGAEIASVGDIYRGAVRLDQLPAYVPAAFVSIEDRRFYHHFGVDPIGLLRAAFSDLRSRHVVQGGSTITQQVAKNLFLTPERTWTRKIREALMAVKLEREFTKDQILTIYLNRVYLGAGTYGIEAASERYFGHPANELSVYQAAVLAGLLRAPTRYSPSNDAKQAATRANVVLQAMVETGAITAAQAETARKQDNSLKMVARAADHAQEHYFVDWILGQLDGFIGTVDRDLVITTTLDPRLQVAAQAALTKQLDASGAKLKVEQGAVLVMSPDGAIRAMVGGRDYGDSQFNRATQALRQPGSAFKPFVYLAGLEAGYGPDDMVTDAPITIGRWTPHNFGNKYEGPVTVETALVHSLNTAAVRIADHAGIKAVIAVAHRLGIAEELKPDLSLALGSNEVTLIELAGAYAPFANGGEAVLPYGIVRVTDRAGQELYRREPSSLGQVIPPEEVAIMDRMMSQVLISGTGTAAAFGYPAAGKTGTTSDFHDAWFMGFTADYVAGVWVGNDSGEDMKGVTGGSLPARVWHDVMLAAHEGRPPRPLPGQAVDAGQSMPAASNDDGISHIIENVH